MRKRILIVAHLALLTGHLDAQATLPTRRPQLDPVIDGASSQALFSFVTGACTLAGGTIVTLSEGVNVRLWTPAGELKRSVGGAGSGPGEFRRAALLGCRADMVWVSDRGLSRITVR